MYINRNELFVTELKKLKLKLNIHTSTCLTHPPYTYYTQNPMMVVIVAECPTSLPLPKPNPLVLSFIYD